jgi:hypothetical protein
MMAANQHFRSVQDVSRLLFLFIKLYKVYIGFLSRVRNWTVAVAQYSIFENMTV